MILEQIIMLVMVMQVKHYLADYLLQFPYMYQNKGAKTGWFSPLFDHAAIHGLFTFIIIVWFNPFPLAIFDLVTHMIIDRWKATREGGPDTKKYWLYLGGDQGLHHIVTTFILYLTFLLL